MNRTRTHHHAIGHMGTMSGIGTMQMVEGNDLHLCAALIPVFMLSMRSHERPAGRVRAKL